MKDREASAPGLEFDERGVLVKADQQAEPVGDERAAALYDSAYCAGLQQGFSFGQMDDSDGLQKALAARAGYVGVLKSHAAQSGQRAGKEYEAAYKEECQNMLAEGIGHWKAKYEELAGQRAGVADAATRMRAAGLGALLSEVYARAGGFLDDDTRERVQQALTDHERAIAAPTQQQEENK